VKAARLQLYELGQLAPATRTLNRVLQINPDNPQAHYLIGVALKDQEQLQAAKAHFNRYLALAPDGEFAQEVRSELANLGTR
jgi:Flp pilus assembly protein TadD